MLQILKFMKGCFVSPVASPGFDELTCHCGASVIYPPVPCGTRPPECTQTCARVHECDHPGGSCLLAFTPHSLLTLCHLGCCMMVFTALRLHCGSPSLFPVLRGCFCEDGSEIWATAGNHSAFQCFNLWMSNTPKGLGESPAGLVFFLCGLHFWCIFQS